MNIPALSLFTLALCGVSHVYAASPTPPSSNYLWYRQPAKLYSNESIITSYFQAASNSDGDPWQSEALPVGNGRIGAMVFGGYPIERLALNEISLWTGGQVSTEAYNYGPTADQNNMGAFQPFADLLVDFKHQSAPKNYQRSLSLVDGIARTSYVVDGVQFEREVFASYPHQVIIMSCKASQAGRLNADIVLKPNHTTRIAAKGNQLILSGTLANGEQFEGRLAIIAQGGTVKASGGSKEIPVTYSHNIPQCDRKVLPKLTVSGADSYTIVISLATDYAMDFSKNWKSEISPHQKNAKILDQALQLPIGEIRAAHIKDYQSLFNRVSLDLGATEASIANQPTDQRLAAYRAYQAQHEAKEPGSRLYTAETSDPDLEETLFQYGRYMLISGSRGNLPANLQGLWNDKVSPPWASDYHSNINIQMCYWGAEPANLSECHLPFIHFIDAMQEPLRQSTAQHFKPTSGKQTRGWTVRTSQNIYGGNAWAWNIPSNAWYARHLWEHFAFTGDQQYLAQTAYPIMKEVCEFWEDNLKELGTDGQGFFTTDPKANLSDLKGIKAGTLVAPNGWSPEHGPREDGVLHDQQLIDDVFANTITASRVLNTDSKFAQNLAEKKKRLAGPKLGKEGNLQEWMIDRIAQTQHRHTSHLYAVYPGNSISIEKTPELAEGARKSLEWRGTVGDSRRSWTWPWRTALWARFKEGDRAHDMIAGLLQHNLLPNLLANHPPMQMDGTYGITGAMCEMFVQSHTGDFTKMPEISLLPAPAKSWPNGSVTGLKARGNITVSFTWEDGKVTGYTLSSPFKRPVKLTVNGETKIVTPQTIKH